MFKKWGHIGLVYTTVLSLILTPFGVIARPTKSMSPHSTLEIELIKESPLPGGNGASLSTSARIAFLPDPTFDKNMSIGKKRQQQQKLIKWVKGKLSSKNNDAIYQQVIVIPADHPLFSDESDVNKAIKELGWNEQGQLVDPSHPDGVDSEEIQQIIESLHEHTPEGGKLLIGSSKNSQDQDQYQRNRIMASFIRMGMVSGITVSSLILSAKNPALTAKLLVQSGIPALVGGSISGLKQYFKDQIDFYMKHNGVININKDKKSSWPQFLAKQYMFVFAWIAIFRTSLWTVGSIKNLSFAGGVSDIIRKSGSSTTKSMTAQTPMNRYFADVTPDPNDTSPKANLIRTRGQYQSLAAHSILTIAEVLIQKKATVLFSHMIFWGVSGAGVLMLYALHHDKINHVLRKVFQKMGRTTKNLCQSLLGKKRK